MARSPIVASGQQEKSGAGWFNGCNSIKLPWILPDTQYRWGVNIVNRGGVPQTRYGYRMLLTLPEGQLQGGTLLKVDKTTAPNPTDFLVFAVAGKVYAIPQPFNQPVDWEQYRLKNLSFSPEARDLYFQVAPKSLTLNSGVLNAVQTHNLVVIQDGVSDAGYWDGETDAHLDENKGQTPKGTWMTFTGQRLWVARGNLLLAGDFNDPLNAAERTEVLGSDFVFDKEIRGLSYSQADSRATNLLVFTIDNTYQIQSSIVDRSVWATTNNFRFLFFPNIGCVSGRSIVNHVGLIWWYAQQGLMSSDSASVAYITSKIRVRDQEMAQAKQNLSNDLSVITAASFESYLLMTIPSGDTLPSQTMVMDFSVADELAQDASPAWQGVWTGIRPLQWITGTVQDSPICMALSRDYISANNSFNHVWIAFQNERRDTYNFVNADNKIEEREQPIYWEFESKVYGDFMELKRFRYAEIDFIELAGTNDIVVSFFGNKGGYNEIARTRYIATIEASQAEDADARALTEQAAPFKKQSRRLRTQEQSQQPLCNAGIESLYGESVDKGFGLRIQGCGSAAIESIRIFTEPYDEPSNGDVLGDETGIKIITLDGEGFTFT